MDPKTKWTFYVNKLYTAELETKNRINEYRNYKKKFADFRYENGLSESQRDLFKKPPIEFIDAIFTAQARTDFCKQKIEFYKTVALEGETLQNKAKLSEIDRTCAKLLSKFGNKLI